jgi:hypothetical protein
MPNLLRKPLTWMILAEFAVVAALTLMAWHMLAPPPNQPTAESPGPAASAGSPDATAQASPVLPAPAKAARQLPGLNVDAAFWRLRLVELNRDEAAFEQLEWRIVHSAMDTTQRYLESVVLPSVLRAEQGGG